jgi:hypothetical protein
MSVTVHKNQPDPVFHRDIMTKSGIELIGIINRRGRMTTSIGDGSLEMPETKKEMFLMKIALRTAMQKDFDEELGEVNYCMTQRANRKFISIPISDKTIFAVTKKEFDHERLVKEIIGLLNGSDRSIDEVLSGGYDTS